MKKLFFIFLMLTQLSFAQNNNAFDLGKNEIKFDVVSLVALGKIHVSYERFLKSDFSIGISGILNESNSLENNPFCSLFSIQKPSSLLFYRSFCVCKQWDLS